MRLTDMKCRINGVHIVDVKIHSELPAVVASDKSQALMQAEYATVEGSHVDEKYPYERVIHTHGKCSAYPNNWSDVTKRQLKALLESMEIDLLRQHFEGRSMEDEDARIESGEDKEPAQI